MNLTPREVELTDEQSENVFLRTKENVSTVTHEFEGNDRLAACHLFSELRHLEEIATLAAIRGDCIDGQLEDEFVHRESFETLAIHYGGLKPACKEIQNLIDFLKEQEGEMSLALLNVVGESWLETVFHHIGQWGLFDELFASIEADEERHVHDALELAKPEPEECEPMVRKLESMLEKIMWAPQFILPMLYFGGEEATANIGLAVCAAHERACTHLGVDPNTKKMRALCRAHRFTARNAPELVDMNVWEQSKMKLWKQPAPQTAWIEVPIKTHNPVKLQAKVASIVGKTLAGYPKLKNVWRRDQLFRTKEIIVGQRFLYDDEQVATVFLHGTEHLSEQQIVKQTNRKIKRIRDEPYPTVIPELGDLEELLPPARCSVVINYYDYGNCPLGPQSNIEGIPIIVMIGKPYQKGYNEYPHFLVNAMDSWHTTITVSIDHRVGDAKDGGHLMQSIKSKFEEEARQ